MKKSRIVEVVKNNSLTFLKASMLQIYEPVIHFKHHFFFVGKGRGGGEGAAREETRGKVSLLGTN